MNDAELRRSYFSWMCQLVYTPRFENDPNGYSRLLAYLDSKPFIYTIALDSNRESDGIRLRYHYAYFHNIPYEVVTPILDNRPCSMLELMVALACKCEDIMSDPAQGVRTSQWFWEMVGSLGLSACNDSHFDEAYADQVLSIFYSNAYRQDGFGGLFFIPNSPNDMRQADIWTQMHWYLNYYHNEAPAM